MEIWYSVSCEISCLKAGPSSAAVVVVSNRIIESSRFRETFKTTQSNHPPSTAIVTTKPHHWYQIQVSASRDNDPTTSLGNLSQCLTPLTLKNYFLVSSLNLPPQAMTIPSCPFIVGMIKETGLHLTKTSFQVVVETDEVSPEPPLLETKHTLLPRPFLIRT